MRFLKILLPVVILGAGLGGFNYLKANRDEATAITRSTALPVVAATKIEKKTLSPFLTLFGQIEAPNNSVLTAGISADVMEVLVFEGSAVDAGQVLVTLDQTDADLEMLQRRAEVVEIEAQLESDKKRYASDKAALKREQQLVALSEKAVARARTLARTSAGTEATLDNALQQEQQLQLAVTQRQLSIDDFASRQKLWQARLEKARAALERSNRDLERTVIRAPYKGRVIEVSVSPGDRTSVGSKLLQMYDDSALEVRTQVPSRYLPTLQAAFDRSQPIYAAVRTNGDALSLELVRMSARVSRGQAGADVFFRATSGALPALGKTVELQLTLPPLENAVALSPDALYGADQVYRIVEGTLKATRVRRLGQQLDSRGKPLMLVDGSGLSDGELILSSRLPQAIDGLPVEVATDL